MKSLVLVTLLLLISCSGTLKNNNKGGMEVTFREKEILEELDMAFYGTPGKYYPEGRPDDIKNNFFLDLENAYCKIAGSKIHLFADSTRWAIVFETSGYETRGLTADITLHYIGNCVNYPIDHYPERNYIANSSRVILIDQAEFKRVENKEGKGMETFELISNNIKEIRIRGNLVRFDNHYKNYEKIGIAIRDYENPNKLIGFGDLIRYLYETKPAVVSATDDDIRKHIPKDIPKLMTITDFHFVSAYEKTNPPSNQETYKLLAKILVTRDTTNWAPTQKPNNSWKNWVSGNL